MLGPLARSSPLRRAGGVGLVVVLTLLTQVLGIVLWPALGLANAPTPRPVAKAGGLAMALVVLSWPLVAGLASLGGRVPLPCLTEPTLAPHTLGFCLAHRHYVRPDVRDTLLSVSREVAAAHPGTTVRFLDAGFPFAGLPLLPHLSHHDGRKVDLALFGERGGSPIGYFGYVAPDRDPACPPHWLDLRWDFAWLQPALRLHLDEARTATLVRALTRHPGVRKLLLEPHLARRLGVRSDKIRFQGCRAARHDDHVHVQ
ncbi:MAG: hypothetical protein AAF602_07090 [Myxococcota bacterium]